MEAGAEQKTSPAANKRLTAYGKAARRKRIFAPLSEGWAYNEIRARRADRGEALAPDRLPGSAEAPGRGRLGPRAPAAVAADAGAPGGVDG